MKHKLPIVTFFIIVLFIAFLYRNTGKIDTNTSYIEKNEKTSTQELLEISKVDKIIEAAKENLGMPYKQAGITKNGFDCSGLIMTSFKKEGVWLPRSSFMMATQGKKVSLEDVQPGDLVFFKTNKSNPNTISHVGLVTAIENRVVFFIHSTTQKGVIISTMDEDYYKNSFTLAKRVL